MDSNMLNQLYETFNLKSRQGTGGMMFKYVPNEDVIHRMNQVFGGNWSTEVKFRDVVDDQVVMEVAVVVRDPETGEYFIHTGYGSSQIQRYKDGPNAGKIIDVGNAYKGALAKGIVNACTRWGVGLFKEHNAMDDDGEDVAPSAPSTPSVPQPKPAPQPVAQPNPNPMPSVPNVPPAAPAPAPNPEPKQAAPAPVVMPPATPANQAPNLPPGIPQKVEGSMNIQQVPENNPAPPQPAAPAPVPPAAPNSTAAPAPPTAVPNFPGPNMEAPPTPNLPFSSQEGNNGISDVQRVALNGILSMRNIQYEDLAKEAFESNGINKEVPNKEQLSYEDAVVIIKYGNDKYRKR